MLECYVQADLQLWTNRRRSNRSSSVDPVSLTIYLCYDPAADDQVTVVVEQCSGDEYVEISFCIVFKSENPKLRLKLSEFDYCNCNLILIAMIHVWHVGRFAFSDMYRALIERFTNQLYTFGLSLRLPDHDDDRDVDDVDSDDGGAAWAPADV